jgi:hypothetical protein
MISTDGKPRRWLQFSLRTLFMVMLVVAAFFGGRQSMRPAIEAERAKALRERDMAEKDRALAELAQYMTKRQQAQFEFQRLLNAGGEAEVRSRPNRP